GLVAMALAAWALPGPARTRIRSLFVETVLAGLLALLVASPFFYYALFSGQFPEGPPSLSDLYGMNLLNPLFPTYTTWLGSHAFLPLGLTYEGSNASEADGYLGIALVVAFLM